MLPIIKQLKVWRQYWIFHSRWRRTMDVFSDSEKNVKSIWRGTWFAFSIFHRFSLLLELCLSTSGRSGRRELFESFICGKHLFNAQLSEKFVDSTKFILFSSRFNDSFSTKSSVAAAYACTRWCCCCSSLVDGPIDNVSFCIVTCDGNLTPVVFFVLYHGAAESSTVVFDYLCEMADIFLSRPWIFRNISRCRVFVLVEPRLHRSSYLLIHIGTVRPGRVFVDILTSVWECCSFEAFIMLKFAPHNVEFGKSGKLGVPRLDISMNAVIKLDCNR